MELLNDITGRVANGLVALRDCHVVGAAAERLFNLLSTPDEIYRDREIMRRVLRQSHSAAPRLSRLGPIPRGIRAFGRRTITMEDLEVEPTVLAELLRLGDLVVPIAIRTASSLGIADHLDDGPATVEILAERLSVKVADLDVCSGY